MSLRSIQPLPMSKPRRRNPLIQIALIALACVLGIGSRRYAHALPGFVAAYAGDTLWALAAFLGIGLILPRASTRTIALLAMAFSVADRSQPVVPRPLDRLDPPDDAGWADPRLRLPLERPGLLRCWGWTRRHPRTDRPGCPQSQEVVSVMRLDPGRPDAPGRLPHPASARDASPFAQRGYYITFMRMPTYDLADWKRIVDGIHDDGGNTLLLWVAGAFRSKKFPITWGYNEEHENVRKDFVRDLIDHAHTRGIKVLLGFTPFGYDGVNQYPLEHPETARRSARTASRSARSGIGCWGYNLCPSRPESQRFMLEYVREMAFDFYPNADGLMIESSDYAICHCQDCGPRFFEKEFEFVKRISEEVWAKKPDATIVVYPALLLGGRGAGLRRQGGEAAVRPPLDAVLHPAQRPPRPRPDQAGEEQPVVGRLARPAATAGHPGRVPGVPGTRASPATSRRWRRTRFVATVAEEGQAWLKGRRQVPLGFGWLEPGDPPYDELPMRVNRIAYREFSRNPDLPFERFKEILGREVFGEARPRKRSMIC